MNILGGIKRRLTTLLVLPHTLAFRKIAKPLKNKIALEVGGPTQLFEVNPLSLYKLDLKTIDGLNMGNGNPFQTLNSEYLYLNGSKRGKQFVGDLNDISSNQEIAGKYDVIISSHVIEHSANALGAIKNMLGALKPGGIIFAVVPHYKFTFDRKRPLTTFEHIKNDYQIDMGEEDQTHIQEQLELHDWSMGGMENFEEHALNNLVTRVVHHHTFDKELLEKCFSELGVEKISCRFFPPHNIVFVGKTNA